MKLYECILSLFGGIAMFITAMNMMSTNIQKLAGPKIKILFAKVNSNLLCAGIGTLVAIIMQNAAAPSVMSISFVNADMINIPQAIGVIIGANFGSSIIGILASLDSLNLHVYFSFVAFIGIVLSFFKKENLKIIGGIICGLGMIFIGLNIMKESCNYDSFKNILRNALEKIDFPLALILIGFVVTCLIQSASAMTGLIVVMVQGGSMNIKSSLFIILGANIGTSTTALISTIGKGNSAKRTGIAHLMFTIFGTFVFSAISWIFYEKIIYILEKINSKPEMQIAWFNVFFKFITSLISLPLINILVLISTKIIKGEYDKNKKKQWRKAFNHINKRFLKVPTIAEEQIKKEIKDIIDISKKNMDINVKELLEQNNQYHEEIKIRNDLLYYLIFESFKFLIKLLRILKGHLDNEISINFLLLNHIIKIKKYIKEISEMIKSMKNEGIKFNEQSKKNLDEMNELISKLFDIAIKSIDNINEIKKGEYLILIKKIKNLENELFYVNYNEIITGKVSASLGFYFISIISIFVNICIELEKIISILKKERDNIKNKSFEVKECILLINDNEPKKIGSSSRNHLSLDNDFIKNVNNDVKKNQSIN